MTPLLTFITLYLTGSVLFLLGWTLGFDSGIKRRAHRNFSEGGTHHG